MSAGRGTLIGGRFRLLGPLGQGGMGRVWRGRDELLDRDVAVKEVLIPPEMPKHERAELIARTTREAKSAARLSHPGIVTIHDVIVHEQAPWIVMQYVAGDTLGAILKIQGPMPVQRAAEIGARVADALAHAHARGIVHRDLKPDNILIAGDQVVITDFGIARILDATSKMTSTGTIMGTPSFMAPEQLEGRQAGPAADLWSLGATLYVAIEGRPPFDGPTLTALITAVLTRDPVMPCQAGPIAGILAQMLAKDPARRPSATAVTAMLSASGDASPATPALPYLPPAGPPAASRLEKEARAKEQQAGKRQKEAEEQARIIAKEEPVTREDMLRKEEFPGPTALSPIPKPSSSKVTWRRGLVSRVRFWLGLVLISAGAIPLLANVPHYYGYEKYPSVASLHLYIEWGLTALIIAGVLLAGSAVISAVMAPRDRR